MTAAEAGNEIARLHELYAHANRKSLPVDLLLTSWGQRRETRYGITLQWDSTDATQAQAANWVKEQVKPSLVAAA